MYPQPIIRSRSRLGFTLLELLMVIAIISILMGMSFYVMNGITESAQQEATKTTVNKATRLLEQRIEAFDRAFKGSRKSTYVIATVGLLAAIDGRFDHFRQHPEQAPAAITMLARKAAFRFEFPQRMAELILTPSDDANSNGLPDKVEQTIAIPNARNALFQKTGSEPTAMDIQTLVDSRWSLHTANVAAGADITESSELLYYTLVASGTFGSSPVDSDQFSSQEIADTDEDGLPEFIDAFGQPLRFYRWPTRLVDTNPMVPFQPDLANLTELTDLDLTPDDNDGDGLREIVSLERNVANLLLKGLPPSPSVLPNGAVPRDLLLIDPDDPVGRLYSELERLDGTDGKPVLALEYNEANYHTPDTFHAPVVMSAGPDEVLGLYEPNDTTNLGNLGAYDATLGYAGVLDAITDNITSRNKKSGGRQ